MKLYIRTLMILSVLLFTSIAYASVPLHPETAKLVKEKKIPVPYFIQHHKELLKRGVNVPWASPEIKRRSLDKKSGIQRSFGPTQSPHGSYKALVLLIEFSDKLHSVNPTYFDSLMFGEYTGTLRDYYKAISYRNLDIVPVDMPSSIGWLTAPHPYSYYVNGDNGYGKMAELVTDVIALADSKVDFSQYDNDGDGDVDAFFIVHTGRGAELSGSNNDIWSHTCLTDQFRDGVHLLNYSTEPEYWMTPGDMTCGVFAHEFGHAGFGLPDLYDTDQSSEGLGNWSLMASGSWGGRFGSSPAFPDPWSQFQMGFLIPTNVTSNMVNQPINNAENFPEAYRLWTDGNIGSEYFLVQNRQSIGYDGCLIDWGLFIYHVDESVITWNRNEWFPGYTSNGHYFIALEQADGMYGLEGGIDRGFVGDPFPGTYLSGDNRNFAFNTLPNSNAYSDTYTNVSVRNISDRQEVMTADLRVSYNAGEPAITVTPDIIRSGICLIGHVKYDTVFIRNEGTEPLVIDGITPTLPVFTPDRTSFTVSTGETQPVVIAFAPIDTVLYASFLTITSNDIDDPAKWILLQGQGAYPPNITVTPSSFAVNLACGNRLTQPLTIGNTGTGILNWSISTSELSPPSMSVMQAINELRQNAVRPLNSKKQMTAMALTRIAADENWTPEKAFNTMEAQSQIQGGIDIAVLHADVLIGAEDVQSKLLATGKFKSVSVIDGNSAIPTLQQLQAFKAVLVYNYFMWPDRTAMGDTLAKYIESGGGVVCGLFSTAGIASDGKGGMDVLNLGGNFTQYELMKKGYNRIAVGSLGTVYLPSHPLMQGVTTFSTGSYGARSFNGSIAEGAVKVANWDDSSPLIVYKDNGGSLNARRVDLGFFPPSDDISVGLWHSATDGAKIMANALLYVGSGRAWVSVNPISGTVAPGMTQTIDVKFDATYLSEGDYQQIISISSNDPLYNSVDIPVNLHAIGTPEIAFVPDTVKAGEVIIGRNRVDTVTVKNIGTKILNVNNITSNLQDFSVSETTFSITPGGEHQISVTFAPTESREYNGVLTFTSDDPLHPTFGIVLQGQGAYPPNITVTPDSFAVDLAIGDSVTQTLTIGNTGGSLLTWSINLPVTSSPSMNVLAINEMRKSTAQSSNETKQTSKISITHSTEGKILTAGKAVNALLSTDGGIDIAIIYAGDPRWVEDVRSKLNATGQFNNVCIIDGNTLIPTLQQLQAFRAVLVCNDNIWPDQIAMGDTLAAYIESGGGVVCGVFATAGSDGWNLGGVFPQYQLIPFGPYIRSTGSLGTVHLPSHPLMQGVTIFATGNNGYRPDNTSVASGAVKVADWDDGKPLIVYKDNVGPANARRVDLGFLLVSDDVAYGSWSPATDGVKIIANALLYVGETFLSVTPTTGSLAPGMTKTVDVKFNAKNLMGGHYQQIISIISDDPLHNPKNIPATLHVIGTPAITVIPDTVKAGAVYVGSNHADTMKVKNIGTDVLDVSNMISSLPVFTTDVTNFSVPPGQEQDVLVRFAPEDSNACNGVLTIASNDPLHQTIEVMLQGKGVSPPIITVAPDSFAVTLTIGDTVTQALTIGNTGLGVLNWSMETEDSTSTQGGMDIALICAIDDPNSIEDVRSRLLATGQFDSVGVFDGSSMTPSLEQLQSFKAVLVFDNTGWQNSTALGNVLSTFIENGGGVVCGMFATAGWSGANPGGNFIKYQLIQFGTFKLSYSSLGTVYFPSHPLFKGVKTFETVGSSFHPMNTTVNAGAIRIADWQDGTPFIVCQDNVGPLNARRVDLGFYPPSDAAGGSWLRTTDGAKIIANALLYAGNGGVFVSVTPNSGTILPHSVKVVDVKFNAKNRQVGDYQRTITIFNSNDPLLNPKNISAKMHVNEIPKTDIPVRVGWNYVSVPRVQSNYNADVVFPGKLADMYEYNSATGAWERVTTLSMGRAYVVYYTSADTITITGPAAAPGTVYAVAAKPGWIYIGSRETPVNVSSLVLTNGAVILSAFRYNPTTRNHDIATTVINPGEVTLLYVTKACTIFIDATEDVPVSGNISCDTTWNENIVVEGNVTVNNGATLTINPGTRIRIKKDCRIDVLSGAKIIANGTASSNIRFMQFGNNKWERISLQGNNNQFKWCVFEYGRYSVEVKSIGNKFTHCAFRNAERGINACYWIHTVPGIPYPFYELSTFSLDTCIVELNSGDGIVLCGSHPSVNQSTISNNGGSGIYAHNSGISQFTNNIVQNNSGFGIYLGPESNLDMGNGTDFYLIPNPITNMTAGAGKNHINNNGCAIYADAGVNLYVGLSTGTYLMDGYNKISSNGLYICNVALTTVTESGVQYYYNNVWAHMNRWGESDVPDPSKFSGSVDYSYPLGFNPNMLAGAGSGTVPVLNISNPGRGSNPTTVLTSAIAERISENQSQSSQKQFVVDLKNNMLQKRSKISDPNNSNYCARLLGIQKMLRIFDPNDETKEMGSISKLLAEYRERLLSHKITDPMERVCSEAVLVSDAQDALRNGEIHQAQELIEKYIPYVQNKDNKRAILFAEMTLRERLGDYAKAWEILKAIKAIGPDEDRKKAYRAPSYDVLETNLQEKAKEAGITLAEGGNTMTEQQLPKKIALLQNYPNPFNPTTTVNYELPDAAHVSLKVYDIMGRVVAVLQDGMMVAGYHSAIFNASRLASGIYFTRLTVQPQEGKQFVQTKKMMLIK